MRGVTLGLFLTVCSIVSGNTYYVSSNGSNTNPGTISSPWATFSYAFNYNLSPGDTVYFRGGVYYTTSAQGITSNPGLVGTAADPICFFNYPGETPIIDGRNKTSESHGVTFYYSSHVKFRGIVVRNHAQFSPDGFPSGWNLYYCTDLSFEQCEVSNIGGRGFAFRWCSRATLINCDAYDVNNNISSSPGGDGDGFFMSPSYHNFTGQHYFYGCRAWRCSDDGWDVENLGQTVIENCWSFNNGFQAYDDPGLGNGFKLNLTPAENVSQVSRIVTNCIAAYNRRTGFTTNDNGSGARSMRIDNNTAYANGKYGEDGYGIQVYNTGSSETNEQYRIFRNNIAYANTTLNIRVAADASYTTTTNSWDNPAGAVITNSDFISVDSTGIAGPRQSDGSLPKLNFLKLASTSDLIDVGVNVGLIFSGGAPDLGYAEYTSGSVEPAIPIYLSSAIDNATPSTLTMTYNLSLASIVPAGSSFAVRVNSTARTVSSVAISGTRVILTLASPVVYGDAVTVAYTKPATNPLQTVAGGQAASITAQNVTNNVAEPGNQLPVVSISSPTKSTAFIVPATITIDAVAYDPDGTVTKVEFFNGNVKLGEILTAPYSYIWKEVPEGTYLITAVATDNKNAKRTSEAVTVVVEKSTTAINQVPVVVITNPRNNKPKKNERVILIAEAYDPDGSIASVEFKSGGALLAIDNTAPYEMIWEAVDTGTFVITVVAIDNLGAPSDPIGIELIVDPDFRANSELINLYPNPNNGNFSVELETQLPEEKNTYTIFNLRGERVYEEEGMGQDNIRYFNVSDIKSGTYVLMITRGNTIMATKKFIKN